MKRIFVTAFALCAIILTASYIWGRMRPAPPADEVMWHESLSQLKALYRHKYRQSLHLTAYAYRAKRDSLHAAAALLHAIAHADAIQCDNCRHAIESLGGRCPTLTIQPTPFSDIDTHLSLALQAKRHSHYDLIPVAIEQALTDNNRYIARMLTWCDATDLKQIRLLEQFCCGGMECGRLRVCPTCGDISWEALSPDHCPHCMTESAKFTLFE